MSKFGCRINEPEGNIAIININHFHNQKGVNEEQTLLQENNLSGTLEEDKIIEKYKKK